MKLPRCTFLYGPKQSGKNALANILEDHLPGALALSFEAPLRDACAGFFYEGSPSAIMRDSKLLPGTNKSPDMWMTEFRRFVETSSGQDTLGGIVLRKIMNDFDCFEHFIVADASIHHDLNIIRVVNNLGPKNCLIINMGSDPLPPHLRYIPNMLFDDAPEGAEGRLLTAFIGLFGDAPTAFPEGSAA